MWHCLQSSVPEYARVLDYKNRHIQFGCFLMHLHFFSNLESIYAHKK